MSSRRFDSRCSSRPVVGHRGDREERLLALVERAGRAEHRAAEGAQEDRRPLDLERLVGQADQVASRRRRPRSGRSRRGRNRAGRPPSDARARWRPARPGRARPRRPGSAGRRTTSARARGPGGPSRPGRRRTRARRRPWIRSGVSVSERIVWRILVANRSRPSRPSPSLAGRTTSRRWVSKPATARARGLGRGGQARLDRGHRWVGRCARPRAAASASSISAPIPGSCFSAVSVWNRPTGRPASPTSVARAASSTAGQALEATRGRRQPVRERRELAGIQREQPVADQVDPVQRVPRVLAQLGVGEPAGLELADQQVAIDDLVRRTGRSSPPSSASQRSVKAGCSARPASVRSGQRSSWCVLADRGGERRVERGRARPGNRRGGWRSRT